LRAASSAFAIENANWLLHMIVNHVSIMAEGKFVSYLRVSTARQGRSGLGLEAQRQAVTDWLDGGRWTLVKEFVEVESGKHADRPQLEKALQLCRLLGAKLIIAKLDRLSRDVHFLTGLEKAGIEFVCADMPEVPSGALYDCYRMSFGGH
jgi:DNA invertase Pin-like site-specific DNA recombinase